MDFEDLNPELQEKLKAANTPDELVALVKEEGMELSDEQLEAMSGGKEWYRKGSGWCRTFSHEGA